MSKKYFDSNVTNPNVYESIDDSVVEYAKELPNIVYEKWIH